MFTLKKFPPTQWNMIYFHLWNNFMQVSQQVQTPLKDSAL